MENARSKNFYKKVLAIALPITLQNLISSSLNLVDNVMIGRLGDEFLASVGMANQLFFLFVLLLFGTNSGTTIFISQFWGKKDVKNIRRVMGIALIISGIFGVIFTIGALFIPKSIMRVFTDDLRVIELGSQYLRIVSLSYIFTAINFSYSFASRSIGDAKLVMKISAISLGVNTTLNYLLIFGNFGFPNLGIKGAAIATVIARIVETTLLLSNIYTRKGALAGKISEMLDLSKDFVYKFFQTTLPVILNEAFWSLGVTAYAAAYGRIGTGSFAAVQIANTIQNIFMVAGMGLGNACGVMIGNQIGADNEEEAIYYAKKYSILAPLIGIVLGVALVVVSPFILQLFGASPNIYEDARRILLVTSFFIPFRMFTSVLVVGILRGGGDTKFSLFLEMGSVWGIGVPMAFMGALVWKLPIYWVVALVSMEEIVKTSIGIPRVISKKWIKNVIKDI